MKKLIPLLLIFLTFGVNADYLRTSKTLAALSNDPNGCYEDQTTGAAATLTLDGALVTGGVCVFTAAQKISFEGSGTNAGVDVVIVGSNENQRQTETLTLSNGGTVHSVYYYKKIESTTSDGAIDGNIEAGPLSAQGAVGPVLVPDPDWDSAYGLKVDIGVATYTVEYTFDNAPNGITPIWNSHEVLAGKTADDVSNVLLPVSGLRLKFTAYTSGTGVMTINQARR